MKKNLLVAFAVLLIGAQNSNAQLANGCIAPNFNATDINGNTWNLYTILSQGKTVFIDISATWCGPCWSYHNSGNLENLYNTYGPSGTNEIMVFLIEGDAATTNADLHGTGGNTQGDWVTGTPYPIIDNATIANSYQITYFPTIYMITPDRLCRENGQISTASHHAAMMQYAFPAIATSDAEINWGCSMNQGIAGCASGVSMSVRLYNASTAPMTSATLEVSVNSVVQQTVPWTGNLASYAYATVNITGVTGANGSNVADITVTGVNGGADTRAANNSTSIPFTINSYPTVPPVTEAFQASSFPPTGWQVSNGGSSPSWTYSTSGFNSTGSARMDFYNSPSGDIDALVLPAMDFSSYVSGTLTFDRSYKRVASSGPNDNLKVKISTNCGGSWVNLVNLTGANLANVAGYTGSSLWVPATASDWYSQSVALNSYLGNSMVLIKFEGLSASGNDLYIDNINVNLVTSTGDIVNIPVQFELYPNPADNYTDVSFQLNKSSDVTVNVVNAMGQVVQSTYNANLTAAEHKFTINTGKLSSGIYSINIISADGISSKKLIKE